MAQALFLEQGDGFMPTGHTRGPWDPMALHGGAAAALMTAALERAGGPEETELGRLGFEFLRPVPMAPLQVEVSVVRPGRRVHELHAELRSAGQLIGRASGLRVLRLQSDLRAPQEGGDEPRAMEGPEGVAEQQFSLGGPGEHGAVEEGFGSSAMSMRWLDDPWAIGPARVWMRPRLDLVDGEPLSPLACVAATADFGNGASAALPFDRYVFINADLTIHLYRAPAPGWVGIDSRTVLQEGGVGMAECVLHDERGPVGRSFQTLVVQAR